MIYLFVAFLTMLSLPAAAHAQWPKDKSQFFGPDAVAAAPVCKPETPPLAPGALGPLKPNMTLRDLQTACPKAAFGWVTSESDETPIAAVKLGDVAVALEFTEPKAAGRAYRISTQSPKARTADGFGPGVALAAMSKAWGKPTLSMDSVGGQCSTYAEWAKQAGLSFRIDTDGDCDKAEKVQKTQNVNQLPRDAKVVEAILTAPRKK